MRWPCAFPLLTAGVLVGLVRLAQDPVAGWTDPRVIAAGVLWLAFAVLVYLRYSYHLRGRKVALLTIMTFVLLLCRTRDRVVAEYALRDVAEPIGVAEWQTRLVQSLPEHLQGSLP